ncbi:hypothetical protein X975_11411, partial [Stegodyphus mimosarum]
MPKRKCSFNVSLQEKYLFMKQTNTPSGVRWEKCRTELSVSHSGSGDIEQHLKSDEHADRAATSMLNFFKKSDAPTLKDLDIAAAEGVWAHHMIQLYLDFAAGRQLLKSYNQYINIMPMSIKSKFKLKVFKSKLQTAQNCVLRQIVCAPWYIRN